VTQRPISEELLDTLIIVAVVLALVVFAVILGGN
jgi:hypothetical protein